jgi:hypothetical protein
VSWTPIAVRCIAWSREEHINIDDVRSLFPVFDSFALGPEEENGGLLERLASQGIIVAQREGQIRVSPNFFDTEDDIDPFVSRPELGAHLAALILLLPPGEVPEGKAGVPVQARDSCAVAHSEAAAGNGRCWNLCSVQLPYCEKSPTTSWQYHPLGRPRTPAETQ